MKSIKKRYLWLLLIGLIFCMPSQQAQATNYWWNSKTNVTVAATVFVATAFICMLAHQKYSKKNVEQKNLKKIYKYLYSLCKKMFAHTSFMNKQIKPIDPRSVGKVNLNENLSQEKIIEFLDYKRKNLKYEKSKIIIAADLNFNLIARILIENSYEDVEIVICRAIELADKNNLSVVTMQHFDAAYNLIHQGDCVHNQDFNRSTAIHEAGHAIVSLYKEQGCYALHNVSIQPCKESSGITKRNLLFNARNENLDYIDSYKNYIIFLLSGLTSEQVFNVGGLSGKNLAELLSYEDIETDVSRAIEIALKLAVSEDYKSLLTSEQKRRSQESEYFKEIADQIIKECYEQAWSLIIEHKEQVGTIADLLMQQGTLSGDEIYELLGLHKPLYDFEEGPLPESLHKNYIIRGF